MRQPKQFLVFPYKKNNDGNYLYAIFCRVGKTERWQGIAGGVEEGETLLEAAISLTANQEANISFDAKVIILESVSTMPVVNVTKNFLWGSDVLLIYEYTFGIDATNEKIKLSREHTKMEWLTYDQAIKKLEWDSNKNALWELNYRLINNKY